jgi:hypothetical protein
MSLKMKTLSVRRKVNILKNPTPTYVSMVNYAATQEPLAVVKRAQKPNGEELMKKRTNKQRSAKSGVPTKAKKGDALQGVSVHTLAFQKTAFKEEAEVVAWLKKNQWTDYKIEDVSGEWKVTSKSAKTEDEFDLHEIALDADGNISALVAKASEKLGKSALSSKSEGEEEEGKEPAADEGTGDDAGDDEGSEDDADDEGSDDGDEDEGGADDTTSEDDADDEGDDDAEGDSDEEDDDDGEEDPEGYGDREGADGSDSIRNKEKHEPKPKDLPGQGTTATGKGKPGHEPGDPGKYRITRRKKNGKNPLRSVDQYVRKFDGYGVYLSGGQSLAEVLKDGMTDGIPPGVGEIFQSLYKAIGNTLKSSNGNVSAEVGAISGEFTEAVVAIHDVWKALLKDGDKAQKAAAKKYFASLEADLQTSATSKKSETADIEAIVAKAIAPVTDQLATANKELARLKKGIPSRRSGDNDDDAETIRQKSEEQQAQEEADDDAAYLRQRQNKSIFGGRGL